MVKLLGLLGCLGLPLIPASQRLAMPDSPLDWPAGIPGNQTVRLEHWCLGLPLQAPQPLLRRLEPAVRARVLAALAGLIILGFALVLLAWWGARFTRRYLKRPWPGSERRKGGSVSEFDWASKPLYSDEDGEQGEEEEPRG